MALPSLPPRAVLAACTGLLLLGGIAGAATVDGDREEAVPTEALAPNDTPPETGPGVAGEAGGAVTTPAPVPAAPGEVTTSTTASPAPAAPGAATTTTSARRAGRLAPPGPLVAPKPGAYPYEATTTSSSGTRTDRSTTTVEAAGTEGASTLQTISIPVDLGGQQATTRNSVAWGAGGAVVRRSLITISSMGQQLDCVWQPAFAQYAGGLAVGKTWTFDTRCTGQIQGFEVTLQQRATRRVTGTAQVAGPSGTMATWTIADDTTVVVTSPLGVMTARSVGSQQLAPALGVPLRTDAKVESSMAGAAPQQATVTTKLLALP